MFPCVCSPPVPTVTLCPLFLSAHRSSLTTVPLCLLFHCANCGPTVPPCPLFPCAYRFSVSTVLLCPMFISAQCFPVPTVPLYPLFLCAQCSPVPTVTVYAHYSFVLTLPRWPLSLFDHSPLSVLEKRADLVEKQGIIETSLFLGCKKCFHWQQILAEKRETCREKRFCSFHKNVSLFIYGWIWGLRRARHSSEASVPTTGLLFR